VSYARYCSAVVWLLLGGMCWGQQAAAPISKEKATQITLAAAKCMKSQDCIAKGSLSKNNWVFVISFVRARDGAGNPLIAPGDWVGITVDPEGHVIDRMAGD
jgi:hypothetical protein